MQIQEITNTVEFDSLRAEWNALLERSSANGVFLTWEWIRTWWTHLAERHKLSIAAIRSEGRLVGIAPLAIRPAAIKRLFLFSCGEFLGSGTAGSDYLDLIVEKGSEEETFEALAPDLARSNR